MSTPNPGRDTPMFKRILARAAVVLALLAGGVAVAASPAMAASPTCSPSSAPWVTGPGGQIRWCHASGWNGSTYEDWVYLQVDDTTTDGYMVHAEVSDTCCLSAGWHDFEFYGTHGECQSDGPVVSCKTGPWVSGGGTSGAFVYLRLVKGRAYTPAQHVAYGQTLVAATL